MARALSPLLALYLLTQLALLPLVNRERRAAAHPAMSGPRSRDSLVVRPKPRIHPRRALAAPNEFPATVLELSRIETP
jgi:hypothetical protein